ncbi:sensor domain-containing diguanylate cyclase [Undibacterium sp. Ji67W]|uniref:sensor domain-containing diguanylate cyclase n=1 Tax=Undibacterium sp. Ji67W TaxID=3413042 RepID=UPI003BEF5E63
MLKKYGWLIWLFLILLVGFAGTTVASFLAARDTLEHTLTEDTLPAINDLVYSEVQKDILRYTVISSQIASNSFVREWIANNEENPEQISQYLKEIKNKNNALSSFLVSDQSRHFYNSLGLAKTLSNAEPRDSWYFRVKNLKSAYEINIDTDNINREAISMTINYRMADTNGKFIGVTGTSFSLDNLKHLIDRFQQRFRSEIYFFDKQGNVVFSSNQRRDRHDNVNAIDGIKTIASQILANQKSSAVAYEYSHDGSSNLVNVRYIPELGWYLIIDKNVDADFKPLQNIALFNLAVETIATLALIFLAFFTIRKYQNKLEKSANTDPLTNLLNRHAFDFIFQQALLDAERSRQPMCAVLLDIDLFKKINDKQGHQVGDHVLKEIAAISKRSLRESDVLCRWGGEEFLILLKNCTLEKATSIAENLRATIANNDFSRTTDLTRTRLSITVSMGVAECRDSETEDSVFERADQALVQAKENGRNSVYFSE